MSERIATEDNQLSHIEQRLNKAYRENKKLQLENHQLYSSQVIGAGNRA
jgi:regulator of replication initiation timing